jgi:hypothetical protein
MPYLVSSLIAIVAATIIMLTRYESDDSSITVELDRMKSMFLTVDGYVNTYIRTGGDLSKINFEVLYDAGILSGNIRMTKPTATNDNVKGSGMASKLTFPSSSVVLQIIPVKDITGENELKDFASSAGRAYKLLVDMSEDKTLMGKAIFSESFSGREFCEKLLFGTFQKLRKEYVGDASDGNFPEGGANNDGLFVCIVFK